MRVHDFLQSTLIKLFFVKNYNPSAKNGENVVDSSEESQYHFIIVNFVKFKRALLKYNVINKEI